MFNLAFSRTRMIISILLMSLLTSGCGGGGEALVESVGSGGTGYISGFVTKGPMSNATVAAYAILNGQPGAQIATSTTAADGAFTMDIGSHAGPVMLQASGGSYTDEATGTAMTMAPGEAMTAVIPTVAAGANNSGIQVTPVTAMAQQMAQNMAGGMTDANIAAANSGMGNIYSVSDILHTQPMNPLMTSSGTGASQDARNYGMTLAAMSQYAQTLGLSTSSAMVTAMMADATDGILDGKAGTASVQLGGMAGGTLPATAGTAGMGAAMNTFMDSAQNKSGVTTGMLVDELNGADGHVPGGGSAMMNAALNGTVFNGPVSMAAVTAFAVDGGAMGAQIASVATDNQGNFAVPIGSYRGPVILQASGVRYMDEATKTSMTMAPGDVITAVVPVDGNNSAIQVTPVTAMAQQMAQNMVGGMTEANIAAANSAMGSYFAVSDILHTQPMNPLVAGSGTGASEDARNYGMTLAAMSRYAQTLGLNTSSTMITAMMNDATDGVMDGMKGGSQISMSMGEMMGSGQMAATAGTTELATAMTEFMNSTENMSGLTLADMMALMQQLNRSDGSI